MSQKGKFCIDKKGNGLVLLLIVLHNPVVCLDCGSMTSRFMVITGGKDSCKMGDCIETPKNKAREVLQGRCMPPGNSSPTCNMGDKQQAGCSSFLGTLPATI